MNTEQLKTFLSVARTGNFSLTARQLIVTQSTVSKRIEELEREVGQALFERGRFGARLTLAGKSLLEYAEQIVSMEEKAVAQINRAGKFQGHLVLGTVYAYFEVYLAGRLERFAQAHPEISVRVAFGHSSQMLAEIRGARIDIAYVHHPYEHPEYECRLVEEDDVILVTAEPNRARAAGVSVREIRELPILASNFLYDSTHSWLFPRDQQFQLELDIAAHALRFLRGGAWYTLLARRMVERELACGELREIPILDGAIPAVRYFRVLRKDGLAQAAIRAWTSFEAQP